MFADIQFYIAFKSEVLEGYNVLLIYSINFFTWQVTDTLFRGDGEISTLVTWIAMLHGIFNYTIEQLGCSLFNQIKSYIRTTSKYLRGTFDADL